MNCACSSLQLDSTNVPTILGTNFLVTNTISDGAQFFRLKN